MVKIVIALVILILLAVVATRYQSDNYREFMQNAMKITARIDQKEERMVDTKTSRKEYWVYYTYTDSQRMIHRAQEQVEYPDIWMSLKESYPVEVYVNKNDYRESHLAVLLDRRLGK